jgi:hypothetical protein
MEHRGINRVAIQDLGFCVSGWHVRLQPYTIFRKRVTTIYVTRVRVRVSDTIRIGYVDTHFLKRKPTKMVYPSIRIRVSGEYRIRIRHPLWSIRVT